MFDLTSMKLLILGLVALIVVGPKDLPVLLRTIGKYVGMIRRQAAEFRSQFDEAMRESELQTLKDELASMKRDVKATVDSASRSLDAEVSSVNRHIDDHMRPASPGGSGPPPAAAGPDEPRIHGSTPAIPATAPPVATPAEQITKAAS